MGARAARGIWRFAADAKIPGGLRQCIERRLPGHAALERCRTHGFPSHGLGDAVLTPTMALGKGWRGFDVQTTFGANLPAGDTQRLGRQLLWNATFQYRAGWKLWPELEANSTIFEQGPNAGETQTFLTPGLGFGRVHLLRRTAFLNGRWRPDFCHTFSHLQPPLDALRAVSFLS